MTKLKPIYLASCLALMVFSSCIDENLSDCGRDYTILYKIHALTDLSATLQADLPAEAGSLHDELSRHLYPVFSNVADEMELHFFEQSGNPAHYAMHSIGNHEASFTIYLPVCRYEHHAVANAASEPMILKEGNTHESLVLRRMDGNRVESHSKGVYVARKALEIDENRPVGEPYVMNLYPVNSAVTLVVNLKDKAPDEISCYSSGFADVYNMSEERFEFSESPYIVEALQHTSSSGQYVSFTTVSFPSASTRAGTWEMKMYVEIGDKTVENSLTIGTPLQAGEYRIIKAELDDKGQISVTDARDVGVSVDLDWNQGGGGDIDIM